MGRWEPNARGRLEEAALDLYLEQGFEETTVAEIAARAGVNERTYFRHFADKREVLFGGTAILQQAMTDAVGAAPPAAPLIEVVGDALAAMAGILQARRARARRRQAVIDANPALQERELIKMVTLGAALAEVLRARGAPDPAAPLAADAGITVFRVAFATWIAHGATGHFADVVADMLRELQSVTATTMSSSRPRSTRRPRSTT
jgi:AcrR family transcriptional regulator